MNKNVIVVCATVLAVMFLAGIVTLTIVGRPTTDLTTLLQAILQGISVLAGAGALIYSNKAARQTNGSLDDRIKTAVTDILNATTIHGESPDGRQILQCARVDRDGSAGDDSCQPPNVGTGNQGNG